MSKRTGSICALQLALTFVFWVVMTMGPAAADPYLSSQAAQVQNAVYAFQLNRSSGVIDRQPDLIALIRAKHNGRFDMRVTNQRGNLTFHSATTRKAWVRLDARWSKFIATKQRYAFAAMGTHKEFSRNLLAGIMLQIDKARHERQDMVTGGLGWLAGPYITGRMKKHPVFFEWQFLYGRGKNRVTSGPSPFEQFVSYRFVTQARVNGRMTFGRTAVRPNFSAKYSFDRAAQRHPGGLTGMAQTVEVGRVNLGFDFSRPLQLNETNLTMTGGASVSWTEVEQASSTLSSAIQGQSKDVKFGLSHEMPGGAEVTMNTTWKQYGRHASGRYRIELEYRLEF